MAMNIQVGSRQEQILTLLLSSQSGMSIDELAAQLDISRNAVKQHLVGLEMQSLVKEAALNSTGGRPARSYSLTEQGINHFPKQYSWFCGLLLDEMAAEISEQALEQKMWDMGVKLAGSLAPQFSHKNPQQKLEALVELLQSLGYHASLLQTESGSDIRAINCVYHDLAQQYPALCQFDKAIISTLLEKPVQQTCCMAKKDCDCRFKIG